MDRVAAIQTWAGLAAVVALVGLYLGATQGVPVVTVAGFAVFAAAMLVTPMLRVLGVGEEAVEKQPEEGDRATG